MEKTSKKKYMTSGRKRLVMEILRIAVNRIHSGKSSSICIALLNLYNNEIIWKEHWIMAWDYVIRNRPTKKLYPQLYNCEYFFKENITDFRNLTDFINRNSCWWPVDDNGREQRILFLEILINNLKS